MPSLFIILIFVVVLLCTGTYVQYGSTTSQSNRYQKEEFSTEAVIPSIKTSLKPLVIPETTIDEACKDVDFQWLAGDRSFWDGWSSKAMFMKKNGKFTRKNVRIQQGETACIAMLLGPIPAVSSIKVMTHYAPSDTIIMSAKSDSGLNIPITLKQHPKQLNAYFASVQFIQPDKYILDTSVDYRSYFWEFPQLHKYLPNKFLSRNQITVLPNEEQFQLSECDISQDPATFKNSIWKQNYYNEYLEFVPNCELVKNTNKSLHLTYHVWGDKQLKRNVQFLKGDLLPTDMCNERQEEIEVTEPISIKNSNLYFGEINTMIHDKVNEYQSHIDGISQQLPSADIVILGVGNEDVAMSRQSPNEFAVSFQALLNSLVEHVYTQNEKIIIKTTQYYGSFGPDRGWNYGRSEAYANIIRYSIMNLSPEQQARVHVWDTNALGLTENGICNEKYMSSYNVLEAENAILQHIIDRVI